MEDSLKSAKKQLGSKLNFEAPRVLEQYQEKTGFKAATEMFSILSPDLLFQFLCLAAQTCLNEFTVSNDSYKVSYIYKIIL